MNSEPKSPVENEPLANEIDMDMVHKEHGPIAKDTSFKALLFAEVATEAVSLEVSCNKNVIENDEIKDGELPEIGYDSNEKGLLRLLQHLNLGESLDGAGTLEAEKENCSELDSDMNAIPDFDNTLEEIDFIISQGLNKLANVPIKVENTGETLATPVMPFEAKQRNCFVTPKKENSVSSSFMPSKPREFLTSKCPLDFPKRKSVRKSFLTLGNKTTKAKSKIGFSKSTKSLFNKLNSPLSAALNTRLVPTNPSKKPITSSSGKDKRLKKLHNDRFAHIISPISTYVKMTPTTPLVTKSVAKVPSCQNLDSIAFRQLEKESRLNQLKFQNAPCSRDTVGLFGDTRAASNLPKKAYISSESKHIIDERTQVTIPGGEKIQKYIQSAKIPSVIRHEGQLKLSGNTAVQLQATNTDSNAYGMSSGAPHARRANSSLANLSVSSGDISMYTVVDARKFPQ